MKRVRMLKTKHLRQDDFHKYRYDAGKAFYLPDNIARMYIEEGAAMEDKSLDAAPETKRKKKKKVV